MDCSWRCSLTGSTLCNGKNYGLPFVRLRSMGSLRVFAEATDRQEETDTSDASDDDDLEDIYIGYDRNEGKRRFIKGDPRMFPRKENLGAIKGATGGWAGGETALLAFCEELKAETPSKTPSKLQSNDSPPKDDQTVKLKVKGRKVDVRKVGSGKDVMYIGFNKNLWDDVYRKSRGEMGKFIQDDARKYPSKDPIGALPGMTGGFAGGERGVQQFISEGEVKFLGPEDISRRQRASAVVIATIVAGFATVGGVLITDLFDISERLVDMEILKAPIDESTKFMLEVAVGLLVFVWIGGGTITLFKTINNNVRQGVRKILVTGGFWLAFLIAGYQIMQL